MFSQSLIVRQSIQGCWWRAGRPRPAAMLLTGAPGGRARRPSLHFLFLFHGLHFATQSLGFAEDAEQVSAQNFVDIVGAVAAVEQGLCDLGQVGGGVNAFGSRAADAVKI